MVELLLDAGADVNSQDNNGHIALEYALFNKQLEIAELLKSVKTK
ncbi:Ankyrin repeats (3 copies) [Phocoenobacter uteri]|uniref:Ankyrin repeats (3 copies) n=1 Tax=Phocoenobacter uteri TaxID=146806 RepID=A0A379CAD6_9PAST|nr:ankyrin repeat domain-containing protein [Phocoenobacter uteri]SUB59270.1 Ankyrin repeats (3 copies) [Phocoenobacter uteri]